MISKSCIARIERVQPREVELIEEWDNCIYTKIKNKKPKFISKKAIERDFIESRKQRTKFLKVNKLSETSWEVENLQIGSRYRVTKEGEHHRCECKDFEAHGAGHRCKHIWAVILDFAQGEVSLKEDER